MPDEDAVEVRLDGRVAICFKVGIVEKLTVFTAAIDILTLICMFFEERRKV